MGRDSGGFLYNKLLGWFSSSQSGTSSLTGLQKSLINSTEIYSRCLLVSFYKRWHSSKICSFLYTEADAFRTVAVTCNTINTFSPVFTLQICVATLCCQWICVYLIWGKLLNNSRVLHRNNSKSSVSLLHFTFQLSFSKVRVASTPNRLILN